MIHLDYKRDISTVKDVTSEAGIIATLIFRPEFSFYSDQLLPGHFTEASNAWMYWAIRELAKKGVDKIDAYNLINILSLSNASARGKEILTIDIINDFIGNAELIARTSEEEYRILVNNVMKTAFRRDTYKKLAECQAMCFNDNLEDIEQKIYSSLDEVMLQFSATTDVPQYKDVVDDLWGQILSRQDSGHAGIQFKFPILNDYCTIESGELILYAAEAKRGKSMMLLNCAVDLLRKGYSVLYIDSELSSRMFTTRLFSHLSKVEYSRVKSGKYNEEEERAITESIEWMKHQRFSHIYMPVFDINSIYTAVKKTMHTVGLDVVIIDYFKSTDDGDAFKTYSAMGSVVDFAKNKLAGDLNIAVLGAVQATSTGKIADSAKIARNASTVIFLEGKTIEEVERDGAECGNTKAIVKFNRNGPQMTENEYIDLKFTPNLILFEQAEKQHVEQTPY